MQAEVFSSTPTRSERLVELLRLDIVRGILPGGTRLTEESLAERYSVSRTPVREALRLLARESLLSYAPRAGYTVRSIDLDEMDDLYVIRCAIEEQSATKIALSGGHGALHNLREYWGDMPASVAQGDVNLVHADEHFHETLATAAGSSVLPSMLRQINARLHVLRIRDFIDPERVRLTFEQHAGILDALMAGDQRLANARLQAHILESRANVRQRFIDAQGGEA
jgi:DNA-binding GntR family transcriptional regulator